MRIWQLISCLAVTLSLWGAASAGASQRPARHGGRSLHITQDAGARVGTVSKSDSTISQFRPRSHLKPTGKGVGLSFVKSLVNLKGCAAGIKVPVSGQFSGWDKNKYLPKVNSFVGVQYPFDYRVAITSSYAFDPVIRAVGNLMGFSLNDHSPKSTYLKRVGVTLSMLYNKDKGLRFSLGPFGQVFISEHHMKTVVLPLLLLLPAILAALFDNAIRCVMCAPPLPDTEAVAAELKNASAQAFASAPDVKEPSARGNWFSVLSSTSSSSAKPEPAAAVPVLPKQDASCSSHSNMHCDISSRHCGSSSSGLVCGKKKWRSVADWNRILLSQALTKTSDLGANLGYYFPVTAATFQKFQMNGNLGSAASLDIQAFHPVHYLMSLLATPQEDAMAKEL